MNPRSSPMHMKHLIFYARISISDVSHPSQLSCGMNRRQSSSRLVTPSLTIMRSLHASDDSMLPVSYLMKHPSVSILDFFSPSRPQKITSNSTGRFLMHALPTITRFDGCSQLSQQAFDVMARAYFPPIPMLTRKPGSYGFGTHHSCRPTQDDTFLHVNPLA